MDCLDTRGNRGGLVGPGESACEFADPLRKKLGCFERGEENIERSLPTGAESESSRNGLRRVDIEDIEAHMVTRLEDHCHTLSYVILAGQEPCRAPLPASADSPNEHPPPS